MTDDGMSEHLRQIQHDRVRDLFNALASLLSSALTQQYERGEGPFDDGEMLDYAEIVETLQGLFDEPVAPGRARDEFDPRVMWPGPWTDGAYWLFQSLFHSIGAWRHHDIAERNGTARRLLASLGTGLPDDWTITREAGSDPQEGTNQ